MAPLRGVGHVILALLASCADPEPAAFSTAPAWSVDGAGGVGVSVAGAGDVDGDGFDDVIIGADDHASVYLGSACGLATTPVTTLRADYSGALGSSVAGAGDVNGDGFDDVVATGDGTAQLFLGSESGLSSDAVATFAGGAGANWGTTLIGAGDMNGDGFADVAVATGARVEVFEGSAAGVSAIATATLATEDNYFGSSLGGGGDFNGDGFDDIVVGINGYESPSGRAQVYYGAAAGTDLVSGVTFSTSLNVGLSLASAGDVDGDGYDDLVAGRIYAKDGPVRAYVFPGGPEGVTEDDRVELLASGGEDWWMASVAGVGDVDADGFDDVVVGAYGPDGEDEYVDLYLGGADGIAASPSVTVSDIPEFGAAVAGAGDVDGDGRDDVLVGASQYGATPEEGAWLFTSQTADDAGACEPAGCATLAAPRAQPLLLLAAILGARRRRHRR